MPRADLLELKIFAMAVTVQQQTGGNLAELLENLAAVVRERFRMRTKVKTFSAEGRLQAVMLMALPPLVFVVMFLCKRSYLQPLFENPILLWGTLALQAIGVLWIRRITNLNVH